MGPSEWGLLIAIIILILLSAFFSASETAFTSANRVRLQTLAQNDTKWAKRALKQIDNYDKLLTTILIGNNIVNIVMASLGTVLFTSLIKSADVAVTVSTAVVTVAVLIFGEITPKTLAKEHPEGFVRAFSLPVYGLSILFWPLTMLFYWWKKLMLKIFRFKGEQGITEDELINYVETARHDGGIDEHESKLIRSAIEFEDLDVGDIMIHRTNVIAISVDATMDEAAEVFAANGYSRVPVYAETIDAVVGILHEKDFYQAREAKAQSFKEAVQNTLCLSVNNKISSALRIMQKSKTHMAIVVDEYGGTAGIVTLEDIIEELVGEIYDEHDEEEVWIRQTGDDSYLVSGKAPLLEVFEKLGLETREEFESSTFGGWITEQLERIPVIGETFDFENLSITVTRATPKRVDEAQIIVAPKEEE